MIFMGKHFFTRMHFDHSDRKISNTFPRPFLYYKYFSSRFDIRETVSMHFEHVLCIQ